MNPVEENGIKLLESIIESGKTQLDAKELEKMTGLEPVDINDAVAYLEDIGALNAIKALGNRPYNFAIVALESRGKYIYHDIKNKMEEQRKEGKEITIGLPQRPFNPIGSPYGFTDYDWATLALQKEEKDTLYVVLGMQFESEYYDTTKIRENIGKKFADIVDLYNKENKDNEIKLKFKPLMAGLGEHLFNEIARNIIGADIAIFETSNLNANVMIELGVALTWGVNVLPIRKKDSPKPPSDISGQTWIEYEESAEKMLDENFDEKLLKMVERNIGLKRQKNDLSS